MKFSVSRNEIYKVLQKIIGVVPTKTTTPILYDILFELDENNLKITATDLEILTSITMLVQGLENGVIAIPAKVINEIIRELGNVEILFEKEEGHRIKLTTDSGEYRIAGDLGEDFPLMPIEENMKLFDIRKKTIKRMIEKCIFTVSQDELRPALMGILFQLHSGEFCMVGTDGHRLSRIISKNIEYSNEKTNFIVPTKALSLLDKNIDQSDDLLKISFSKNYIVFDSGDIKIFSRLVDSEYPDYESVIPAHNEKTLLAQTDLLLGSIRRVSIFSSSLTRQIKFSLESDKMEIYSQNIEVGGEGREKISVEYSGELLDIGFNAQYFMDLLKHIDTKQVKILLETPITAVVVLQSEQLENEDLLMILMPVRLNEYYSESSKDFSDGSEKNYQRDYSDGADN